MNPHASTDHDGADGGASLPSPPSSEINAPVHCLFAVVTAPLLVGGLGYEYACANPDTPKTLATTLAKITVFISAVIDTYMGRIEILL